MTQKKITLVVSDLHVGGGPADPGDDHVYDKEQFAAFVNTQAALPEGRNGNMELIVNGDFLEFAQTNQQAHSNVTDEYWCSEEDSLKKLETITSGHEAIFEALRRFLVLGNAVTLAAGNHDVDLYWPMVQSRLRAIVGTELEFETGRQWYARYDGLLQISHGHMDDPANSFKHWEDPFVRKSGQPTRLEMCPGTLFMTRFVNGLESRYPFADNLQPISKLAWILLNDDKAGFVSVGWMLLKMTATSDLATLRGTGGPAIGVGIRVLTLLKEDDAYAKCLAAALQRVGLDATVDSIRKSIRSEMDVAREMYRMCGKLSDVEWRTLFEPSGSAVLSGDGGNTLGKLVQAGFVDGKILLRKLAAARISEHGASVVVMGHTHLPDDQQFGLGKYFNPGSWTRYMELSPGQKVVLADLTDESRFPYALNYVRIDERSDGTLASVMRCVDTARGRQ